MADHSNESQLPLEGILSGAERPAPPAEPAAAPPAAEPAVKAPEAPAASPAQARAVDGKFAEKAASAAAPPDAPKPAATAPAQPDMTPKEKALLKAAQDERGKRQALERQLAEATAKPAAPAKEFWADPEGAMREFSAKMEGVAVNTKLNTAEVIARANHPDFDDKVAVFADILGKTPGLREQWILAPDPAEFAYQTGKNHQEIQQLGSIDAVKKDVEEKTAVRVRAEVEAEFKAKAEAAEKERAALPGSLSGARGIGGTAPVWSGPTSLDNILKND